jgi:kumamolisin
MRLVLTLPLRNEAGLQSFLQDVYNPSSPSFHKFLTVDEFAAAYGPTQEDYNALIGFAQTHGLTVVGQSRNHLNLQVTGSVASIEAVFHITLGLYKDPENASRTFFAPNAEPTPDLSIPLWHISGLDNYSIPQTALVRRPAEVHPDATTGSCPSASFCGSDMRAAYYGSGPLTGAGQTVGLFELLGTDLADLNTYYTHAHQALTVPISLISTDGSSTACLASAGCDDTEQTLDMTQALGMAPGLAGLNMYVGSSNPVGDAAILNSMATHAPLDAQLACSWLWRPPDPTVDDPYFLEFAAQGQNFFAAAGDSRKWPGSNNFYWPADDPNIVSVGGTDLTTIGPGGAWASETAWSSSGGGISPDKFAIPSWQVSAAAGCVSCSQVYRNGPDISANSNYTFYVCADQTSCTANLYGGTSFATPMWAGYLALANQQSMTNSSTTLGFINPALYATGLSTANSANYHDVTSGSNGFPATVGYDLVTGWGSPNGSALIDTLAGPAGGDFAISAQPKSITIARGAKGGSKITASVSGGFNSAIALTATVTGSNIKIGFNPSSIAAPGSGTATMIVTVGANVTPGTRKITVTGTGGGKTHTTTVALTVQ